MCGTCDHLQVSSSRKLPPCRVSSGIFIFHADATLRGGCHGQEMKKKQAADLEAQRKRQAFGTWCVELHYSHSREFMLSSLSLPVSFGNVSKGLNDATCILSTAPQCPTRDRLSHIRFTAQQPVTYNGKSRQFKVAPLHLLSHLSRNLMASIPSLAITSTTLARVRLPEPLRWPHFPATQLISAPVSSARSV